jgi:hypothetical protein
MNQGAKRPQSPGIKGQPQIRPNSKHSRNSNLKHTSDDVTPEYFTKTVNVDSLKRMILYNQQKAINARSVSASSHKSRTKSVTSETKPRHSSASK